MSARREIAIVSFAEAIVERSPGDDCELLFPVLQRALGGVGLGQRDIGFTVSGSSDFLGGRPFAFVMATDVLGAWPPIRESHVEMDGAFALYEAWVRLQHGDLDTALVYAFGRPSQGPIHDVLSLQLDPYYAAPLRPDALSLGALGARAALDAGLTTEAELAGIASARRGVPASTDEPYLREPLRAHAASTMRDGAAVIVLAAGDRARALCPRPAWISGIDHRIEAHSLGARDLARSTSTEQAARAAGALGFGADTAELHARFAHEEVLLRRALELPASTRINPSGGALANDPLMVTGLCRLGHAARAVMDGASRAIGHATSGPCLQQNLVCALEARP
ncbi:MAG: lipid-transfer protein [Polyangiaceae bacterium]|nr:lipid-transfer protein [Polyangiaceae bacterium]